MDVNDNITTKLRVLEDRVEGVLQCLGVPNPAVQRRPIHIAVLQPGAGYTANRAIYDHLSAGTVDLLGDTGSPKHLGSFADCNHYPPNWDRINIDDWDRFNPNLCTLAYEVIQ